MARIVAEFPPATKLPQLRYDWSDKVDGNRWELSSSLGDFHPRRNPENVRSAARKYAKLHGLGCESSVVDGKVYIRFTSDSPI